MGDLTQLDPSAFEPPTQLERVLAALQNAETVYGVLTLAFAAALLSYLRWWREAGFNAPSRWKSPYLALPPLVIAGIALSDGVRLPEGFGEALALVIGVSIAVLAEEAVFRGLLWRSLIQTRGPFLVAALTAVLSGVVVYGVNATGGPVPEARFITALTLCGGFAYAAIRYRTASIWPAVVVHFIVSLSIGLANLGSTTYQLLLYIGTFGFVAYGILLLVTGRRNQSPSP